MKKFTLTSALMLMLTVTFCSGKGNETEAGTADAVKWYTFDEGMKAAALQKKPAIVDFYADWCTWCVKMEKEVFTEKSVFKKLSSDFIMIRIDTESDEKISYKGQIYSPQQFSTAFEVTGLPTLLFIDKKGEPVTKVPGYIPADTFLKILEYMSDECYDKKISFQDYSSGLAKCGK